MVKRSRKKLRSMRQEGRDKVNASGAVSRNSPASPTYTQGYCPLQARRPKIRIGIGIGSVDWRRLVLLSVGWLELRMRCWYIFLRFNEPGTDMGRAGKQRGEAMTVAVALGKAGRNGMAGSESLDACIFHLLRQDGVLATFRGHHGNDPKTVLMTKAASDAVATEAALHLNNEFSLRDQFSPACAGSSGTRPSSTRSGAACRTLPRAEPARRRHHPEPAGADPQIGVGAWRLGEGGAAAAARSQCIAQLAGTAGVRPALLAAGIDQIGAQDADCVCRRR